MPHNSPRPIQPDPPSPPFDRTAAPSSSVTRRTPGDPLKTSQLMWLSPDRSWGHELGVLWGLFFCLYACWSTFFSFFFLSFLSIYILFFLSSFLSFFYLSICSSIASFVYKFTYLPSTLSVYVSISCQSVYLLICISISNLSVYPPACISI